MEFALFVQIASLTMGRAKANDLLKGAKMPAQEKRGT